MQILNNIDLVGLPVSGLVVEKLASEPTGVSGRVYFNTVSNKYFGYDGSSWIELGAGSVPAKSVVNISSNYTILSSDGIIVVDSTSVALITLPTSASVIKMELTIINKNGGTIEIDAPGSDTIDGASSFTIYEDESIDLYLNNGNWSIV